jgi:hypothetical protein
MRRARASTEQFNDGAYSLRVLFHEAPEPLARRPPEVRIGGARPAPGQREYGGPLALGGFHEGRCGDLARLPHGPGCQPLKFGYHGYRVAAAHDDERLHDSDLGRRHRLVAGCATTSLALGSHRYRSNRRTIQLITVAPRTTPIPIRSRNASSMAARLLGNASGSVDVVERAAYVRPAGRPSRRRDMSDGG